jgi:exodeoxyribonuclease VII small subunit
VSEPSGPNRTSESTPATTQPEAEDLAGLSYESARSQLVEVVNQLESGGVPLDESLALWERGERLAQVCQRWLDGAQAKIDAARP